MDQLSRPYQIALGAILVFALAYFLVLKPSGDDGGDTAAAPTAPGQTGLGNAVQSAQGAVATANGTTGAPATAPGAATGTTPATGATAATGSGVPEDDPSAKLLSSAERGKVVALLFAGRNASDDNRVKRALASIDKHDGRVVTRVTSINRVASYGAITQGTDVSRSPTLVVFGKAKRARTLVGYVDTRTIDQLVTDVGGGTRFTEAQFTGYRRRAANICRTRDLYETGGTALNGEDGREQLRIAVADVKKTVDLVAQLRPTRRYVPFHKALLAYFRAKRKDLQAELVVAKRTRGGDLFKTLNSVTGTSLAPVLTLLRAERRAKITCLRGS